MLEDANPVRVWSDAPDRIVVYWGDPSLESYKDGFKEGEQYIVRWQKAGASAWSYVNSSADSLKLDGKASVGDPDLVIQAAGACRRGARRSTGFT